MGIEVVGYASRVGPGSLSLTGLSGGIDTAARANDLVVVIVWKGDSGSGVDVDLSIVTPSGYSLWANEHTNGGSLNDTNLEVWAKTQPSTPDTSITIPTGVEVATAYVLRGHDSTTPLDTSVVLFDGVFNVPNNQPVTTVTPEAMVLAIAARGTGENTTTAPSGYSNLSKIVDSTGLNWICVANKIVSTPGVEDPGVWQNATDANFVVYATATIAIRPSSGKMKVWNGSAWVEKPVKVWNGSSWVTKPVKYWNGTSWVLA